MLSRLGQRTARTTTALYRHAATSTATAIKSQQDLDKERDQLVEYASFVTRSFYRVCVRCVFYIRQANEYDEEMFRQRFEEQFTTRSRESMMPPVDREDELESRSQYYWQYARENVICYHDVLERVTEQTVDRYIQLLQNGEMQRRWLLRDMRFEDKYKTSKSNHLYHNKGLVEEFERRAEEYFKNEHEHKMRADPVYASTQEEYDPNDDGDEDEYNPFETDSDDD